MPLAAASDFTAIPRWSMVAICVVLSESVIPSGARETSLPYSVNNFFYQSIRVALMRGDFGGVAGDGAVGQLLACFFQQSVAQHGDQTRFPVLGTTLKRMISG